MTKIFAELLSEVSLNNTFKKDLHETVKKGKSVKSYEKDPYTDPQNFLYNRALYGLSVYTEEEIKKMHPKKRMRIKSVHKRAQTCLNLFKQEIVIALSDRIFSTLFPDAPMTKELLECPECNVPDDTFKCKLSFKTLKIKKEMIVKKFIEEGILPKDFNHLNKL